MSVSSPTCFLSARSLLAQPPPPDLAVHRAKTAGMDSALKSFPLLASLYPSRCVHSRSFNKHKTDFPA
eukprot:711744-Prorocentrum_minimum.AAC.2